MANFEFVQIEAGEDAASVRDRLSFLRGQQVLLIWPEEGTALTRKLDLVLIQREAMRRAIRLALVTHDAQVIENARDLNISTFETIGASQRGRWKRGRAKVFTSRFQKPKDEPEPEDLIDVASRVRVKRDWALPSLVRLAIVAVLLGCVGVVAYLLVPGATVTLVLAEQEISVVDWSVTADPTVTAVDIENSLIPARVQLIEIEEVGTRPTSGTVTLPNVAARGRVAFINRTENTINIPAGTVVTTTAGEVVRYRTLNDAVLPAGAESQIEVDIEALPEFAGTIGNIETGVINTVESEWRDNVTVVNLQPVRGGESPSLPAVTQNDRDRLRSAVRQQLQARALAEFQPLSPDEIAIPETVRIAEERTDWTTYSAEVGEPTDVLTLTMRARVAVVVVDNTWAEQIAFAQMGRQIPRGRVIKPDSLEYLYGAVTSVEGDRVTFNITGIGRIAGEANIPIIQERLAGLTVDEAISYLNSTVDLEPGIQPIITITPEWFGRMPMLPVRITVRVATR